MATTLKQFLNKLDLDWGANDLPYYSYLQGWIITTHEIWILTRGERGKKYVMHGNKGMLPPFIHEASLTKRHKLKIKKGWQIHRVKDSEKLPDCHERVGYYITKMEGKGHKKLWLTNNIKNKLICDAI